MAGAGGAVNPAFIGNSNPGGFTDMQAVSLQVPPVLAPSLPLLTSVGTVS